MLHQENGELHVLSWWQHELHVGDGLRESPDARLRSVIVPRFLYVQGTDWASADELSPEMEKRMKLRLKDMKSIQFSP